VDCIAWSAASFGAVAAANTNINILDGATVIWNFTLAIPTAAVSVQVVPVTSVCGLNLVGTTNTSMTVRFNNAVANLAETINGSFFNVN
jgi:flavin-binding protein dodecin